MRHPVTHRLLFPVIVMALAAGCGSEAERTAPPSPPAAVEPAKAPGPEPGPAAPGPAAPSPPPAPQPPTIQIDREKAIQIVTEMTRGNARVSNARIVQFVTRDKEPQFIAVWILDLGDATTPGGYVVIDAVKGDVLGITNAHSGQ